ncbi:MAG: precorrin-6A reductase [Lachnospiraceae bacterium]|nr:precorrin-6A reductase [Lachnospiraceae bacterium]
MGTIIIFAGTSEGRELATLLLREGKDVLVSVASGYGAEVLSHLPPGSITEGRLTSEEMEDLIHKYDTEQVVDATHPYAMEVSRNIRSACLVTETPYIRLLRQPGTDLPSSDPDVIKVRSVEEAAACLASFPGNALITTGSRDIMAYTSVPDYTKRLTVRVLPSVSSIEACRNAGFDGAHIIAMQGPFSEEMNALTLKELGASFLVTKDSGEPGGFTQKLSAAKKAGAKLIVIGRPHEEEGFTFDEVASMLIGERQEAYTRGADAKPDKKRTIFITGAGMGTPETLTRQAEEAFRKADVIIGSKRITGGLAAFHKPVFISYKADEIEEFLSEHPEYRTCAVALSGDVGFYSGARGLIRHFSEYERERLYDVKTICGISSVQYFFAKCGIPWENAAFVSSHGRDGNPESAIQRNRYSFLLAGGKKELSATVTRLCEYGFGDKTVMLGLNLSCPDEEIRRTTVSELAQDPPEGLAVLIVDNPDADSYVVSHGIPDGAFFRGGEAGSGRTPMTKEEIRSVAVSKLRLTRNAVVIDIGAGTGSVAVEAARLSYGGRVYAIERKESAAALIMENAKRFGVTNLAVITGEAPEALRGLPPATHAFIGGSGGRMAEICDLLMEMNPGIRIVITAVSLEGIAQLTEYMAARPELECEVTEITAARSRLMGRYHLMEGMNPVFVAVVCGA